MSSADSTPDPLLASRVTSPGDDFPYPLWQISPQGAVLPYSFAAQNSLPPLIGDVQKQLQQGQPTLWNRGSQRVLTIPGGALHWMGCQEETPNFSTLTGVLNSAPGIIVQFRLAPSGEVSYTYYSPRCETLYGYAAEALRTDPTLWQGMVHPEDWEQVIVPVIQAIGAGQSEVQGIEYRIRDRWGNWRWLGGSLRAEGLGETYGWMVTAVFIEITAGKNRSQLSAANEERLRLALEAAQMGCWDWDLATNQVKWSPGLLSLMGLKAADFDGRLQTVISLIHPEDRARVQAGIQASLDQHQPYALEFRFLKPDGQIRWAASKGNVHRDSAGQPIRIVGVDMDITERKQMEESLRRQEIHFRTLVENTPDGILRCNRQHQFLYVNPSVVVNTGLSLEQFLGKTPAELGFPPPLIQEWQAAITRAFETGHEQHLETHEDSTGGPVIFSSRIVPERDAQGEIESVLIISREISDLHRAQQLLLLQAERERILSTITQHIHQSLDVQETLDQAVQSVRTLLQADRVLIQRLGPSNQREWVAEAVRSPWMPLIGTEDPGGLEDGDPQSPPVTLQRIPDRDRAQLRADQRELLSHWQVRAYLAVPWVRDQALWAVCCVHHCTAPHLWEDWEVELIQHVGAQLALALHQAELYHHTQALAATLEHQVAERTATLEQSLLFEATLRRITDKVRDSLDEDQILETAVTELGQTLNLLCCDTGIYDLEHQASTIAHEFTQTPSRAKGKHFRFADAFHPEVYPPLLAGTTLQFCELLSGSFRDDQSRKVVLVCPLPEKGIILGDMWLVKPSSEAFSDAEVRLVEQVANQCAIAIRQARLYQASQAQIHRLAELNRLKEEFIHTVSHELRTPLTNMKMALTLLEASQNQPHKQQRYLDILRTEWQRELALVNELLELQALESGTRLSECQSLGITDWLDAVMGPFHLRCHERGQQFQITRDPDLPTLWVDKKLLEQVVLELLNNACKYTPPEHTIRVIVDRDPDTLRFQVINTGVTLEPEHLAQIFAKFYRVPQLDVYNQGGTGLGLALAEKAAAALGGSLDVKSTDNHVSFTLRIPITAVPYSLPADKLDL